MKRFLTLCLRSLGFAGILLLYCAVIVFWTIGGLISVYFLYKLDVSGTMFRVLLAITFFIEVFALILLTHLIALSVYPWFPFVAVFCYTYPEDIGKKPIYRILLSKKNLLTSALCVLCVEIVIAALIVLW